MAENIPPWLSEGFLASVLQGENSDIEVEIFKYSAYPAVEAGNNYFSHVYRVSTYYKIDKKTKSTSLFVKIPVESGFVIEITGGSGFFEKESRIYKELLPKLADKIHYQFGPESFFCPLKNGMILKDLNAEGYIMCDKFKQLDYEHCEKVVLNLAKYHACSVACYHDDPNFIHSIGKEVFYTENVSISEEYNKTWINSNLNSLLDIVDKDDPSVNYLTKKTEEFADRRVFAKIFKPKENGLNVLNHGDLWTNNIMFKHNDAGQVLDVKFVDYQITRYASPALDLIYFIWTSANEDVRETKIKSLLDTYLQNLNETLEELECEERMTEKELQDDLIASINHGFVTMIQALPVMMCDVENVVKMEEVSMEDLTKGDAEEKFKKFFKGKYYPAIIPKMLKQFYSWASSLNQK